MYQPKRPLPPAPYVSLLKRAHDHAMHLLDGTCVLREAVAR